MLREADMGVLFTFALCLLGLLALTTQCVTGDVPDTTVASADVTTDGGIVTFGLTNGVTDLVSGNRLTDTDKRGQRLKGGHRRDGRKSKKGRRGRNRKKGQNIRNKTPNRKMSFKAGPEGQSMKELPRSGMRHQDCVKWDPEANITLNLTEKTLSMDYCNPYMASLPETLVCLIRKEEKLCEFVDSGSCSIVFKRLANGNYSVWIQAVCDTCVRTGKEPCFPPGYLYPGHIMKDPPTSLPPTVDIPVKPKRGMALELVLAISAGSGLSVVVIGLVVVYCCIRKKKPLHSENSSESPTTSPSSPESRATQSSDDGNSPQSVQFREQHQYEPLIPSRTETNHQTVPKTTAGGTRASALLQNSPDARRCSPCSYAEERETSFTVRDRKEASPLLQCSSEVCHGGSQTMEGEDSIRTLPFSPGRLVPAYSVDSCVTIDNHDWSGDPTPPKAAPPATPSLFSWNGATLAECIEMDNKGPGIMTTSGKRRNEFSELIPMNVKLILNENGRNQKPAEDKQATKGGNLQESEVTMFNYEKDESALDTSGEKLYENTGLVTQDMSIPEVTIVKSGLDQYRQGASQVKFCEKMALQIRRKMEDSYGHERNRVEDYD